MNEYLLHLTKETQKITDQLKREVDSNPNHPLYSVAPLHTNSLKDTLSSPGFHVIAEIKRQSPSKGKLANILSPETLARQYAKGQASAISVLTNKKGFNGSLEDLHQVSNELAHTHLPILRKDFILDPIQITQSIYYGANAILLIVALTKKETASLLESAQSQGIDALVEVHTQVELDFALEIGAKMIGINNRDLMSFKVNTQTALLLKKHIPENIISVAESGINTVDLAKQYRNAGFNGILVGEALVKHEHPDQFIREVVA